MSASLSVVDVASVGDLARQVSGPVLARGDARRPAELAGFNIAVGHDPDVVLGALDAADVAAGVGWAAERGLPVGVLATGHGWAVPVTGGLLITTRRMQDLALDPATGRLRVGAGVTWRTVLDAAASSGWAPPCGSSSGVGVVGFCLGGGLPVMGRAFGFAADRVTAVDVVTADRARPVARTVTATSDPELFRALCGGGGNLGVVTALEMTLPRCSTFHGGGLFFPGAAAEQVLTTWALWSRDLPDAMSTSIALLRLPPLPELPEPLRGQFVVHVRTAFAGDAATAEAILAPLRALAAPVLLDTLGELPYAALDAVHMDPPEPAPFRHGGVLLDDLPADARDRLLALAGPDASCPLLLVELRRLGGALRENPDPDRSVLTGRTSGYSLHALGMLVPPVADHVPAAITTLLSGMTPWADGSTLLNLHGSPTDEPDDAERARAWNAATLDRLVATKSTADPGNSFRLGHTLPAAR